MIEYDLKEHMKQRIPVIFLVKSTSIKTSANTSDFMILTLKDKDVEVDAKIWGVTAQQIELVQPGNVYAALVDVKPYEKGKDGLSCIIYSIEKSDIPPEALADWEPHVEQCTLIIKNALEALNGTTYGSICKELILNDWNKFAIWSAGKGWHHTQLGALLCHTATVTKTALRTGQFYNEVYGDHFINIQLLIAGGLLHDIGKLTELEMDVRSGATEYTVEAALQTHLTLGIVKIERAAIKLGIDPDCEELKLLEHMIVSHHGQLEWGSPIQPNIPEACILHHADAMDSEMWRYNKHLSKMQGGTIETIWQGGKGKSIYKEVWKDI